MPFFEDGLIDSSTIGWSGFGLFSLDRSLARSFWPRAHV